MKRVSSLSTESIIRIIPASEKPQSLSVATTTKKSVARVLEFDFRNAHANERLIEETQKQIENKRLFVDELTTKITQLKSERDALEIDLQNTQRQLALAHE